MELWDLYNVKVELVGTDHIRGEQLPDNYYHLVVHIWIKNSENKFLISRRSATRPTSPLKWETFGGSVVKGETSLQGALREVKEEIGLDLDVKSGRLLFRQMRGFVVGKPFDDILDVWLFIFDGNADLENATTDEVCETKWASFEEVKELYNKGETVKSLSYIFEDEMNKSITEPAVTLIPVEQKDRDVLFNLLEKYLYEFSQYDGGKFGNTGVFGYPYIDNYFTEKERFAYFIMVDDRLAGFVLLNNHPDVDKPIDYSVAEFFVAYNFRRQGVATRAMEMIFQKHNGYYHIKYHKKNLPSVSFWNKLADKYSNGTYETLTGTDTFHDGTESTVLWFKVE